MLVALYFVCLAMGVVFVYDTIIWKIKCYQGLLLLHGFQEMAHPSFDVQPELLMSEAGV
jgi:hypothetical protein